MCYFYHQHDQPLIFRHGTSQIGVVPPVMHSWQDLPQALNRHVRVIWQLTLDGLHDH